MEYLKLFTQHSDYEEFINGGGVDLPNVSYCEKENEVHYNPIPTQLNNEIWYTSKDGNIVEPYSGSTTPFLDIDGNNIPIVSNTYENGKGIIKLQKDCYQIGDNAFTQCFELSNIDIPNLVTYIGKGVFSSCTSLNDITIPNSVSSIDNGAFSYSSLTGITIPDSVTFIGSNAFSYCTSLIEVIIPNSIATIDDMTFSYCFSLTNIIIPDSVTKIGVSAFNECRSLTGITIPSTVNKIENNTFNFCSGLANIVIADSVTSIGARAFYNCSSLTGITIPDSVTTIGDEAFQYCSNLSYITILSETPPNLGSKAFFSTYYDIASNLTIYVPSGSANAYKTAENWLEYVDKIQAIE